MTPLAPFRPGVDGPWDRGAAWHLACRAGFGPAPAPGPDSIEEMLAQGLETALERFFAPRGHDPALVAGVQALLPTGEIEHLASWWMALILGGGDALGERMALVWHDHFATSHTKVQDVRLMLRQNELFRARGLGDFRELLRLVAVDPAMLVWLDGNENRAGQPNENFARELLELFALGIGNYTEDDVREAARAFTGWGTLGRSFHHRPEHHDGGEKVIFGRRGPFDGEAALELVLEHPACPHWIARRLLAAFVTQSPSDGQIDEVAAALLEEHWQVGATLRRLLASRLFFAPEQRRARIAAPVELVARSARITGARLAPAEAARAAARMGQALFRPPSVKGWSGAHAWIDAGTWIARHNLLVGLACDPDGPGGLAAALGNPSEPRDVPAAALGALFAGAGDERLVRTLEGEAARAPDTGAALCSVAALLMTAPEYHLT